MGPDIWAFLSALASGILGVVSGSFMQRAPERAAYADSVARMTEQLNEISKRDLQIVELDAQVAKLTHTIDLLKEQIEKLQEEKINEL